MSGQPERPWLKRGFDPLFESLRLSSRGRTWDRVRALLPLVAMLVLVTALTAASAARWPGPQPSPDGLENTALAYHLWTAGSYSLDGDHPSYVREPLPVVVTAAYLALAADVPQTVASEALLGDPTYASRVLRLNLYYVAGLLLGTWLLAWLLTRSHLVGALAVVGSWAFFSRIDHNTTNILSEAPAAMILVLAAAAMVWLVQTRRPQAAVLVGLGLGALALTKAAALYVALVAIPLLVLAMVVFRVVPRRAGLTLLAVAALSFALLVVPWMVRNYVQVGEFAIAERGGVVLYTRAIKDQMTPEEYRGSFYIYAPAGLRGPLFEGLLGFRPEDRSRGGPYERLMRYVPDEAEAVRSGDVEHAVSYWGRAWATRRQLQKQMQATGRPLGDADRILQERAEEMIAASPGRHLALTLPFAWRGLWSFAGTGGFTVALLDLFAFASLLVLPAVALWKRRLEWFALSLVAVGLFWFHALFTHFIPRYSEPMIPLAVVSGLVVLHAGFVRLRAWAFPADPR